MRWLSVLVLAGVGGCGYVSVPTEDAAVDSGGPDGSIDATDGSSEDADSVDADDIDGDAPDTGGGASDAQVDTGSDAASPECGDGEILGDEQCDDGSDLNGTAFSLCTIGCRSGVVELATVSSWPTEGTAKLVRIMSFGGDTKMDAVWSELDSGTGINVTYDFEDGGSLTSDHLSSGAPAIGFIGRDDDANDDLELYWVESGETETFLFTANYDSVSIDVTPVGGYPHGDFRATRILTADFDDDGDYDLFLTGRTPTNEIAVDILSNDPAAVWILNSLGSTTALADVWATPFFTGPEATLRIARHLTNPSSYMIHTVSSSGAVTAGTETEKLGFTTVRSIPGVTFTNNPGQELAVLREEGHVDLWIYAASVDMPPFGGPVDLGSSDIAVLDANLDGLLDVAVIEPDGEIALLVNGGKMSSLVIQRFSVATTGYAIDANRDATGDGIDDMVVSSEGMMHYVNFIPE